MKLIKNVRLAYTRSIQKEQFLGLHVILKDTLI